MPKISVEISWNKPDDIPNWLEPEGIKWALETVCKNTNFEVKEIKEGK